MQEEELGVLPDLSVPRRLPAGPAGVTMARHATRRQLTRAGIASPDVIDTAELLVSELTSNVVKHTDGRATLMVVCSSDSIHIEVGDARPDAVPVERDADTDADAGRGLRLVSRLATSWGWEKDAAGKRTWAELDIPH